MKPRRPSILMLWLLVLGGCQPGVSAPRVGLEGGGSLYVYVDALPREAERLRVGVSGIAALDRDGRELALSLRLRALEGRAPTRQRLLAVGVLPPGEYRGLALRVASASLGGEGAESPLLVPDAPVRIDFGFAVEREGASVIALALRHAEAVETGFSFQPAFSAYVPDRPAVGLMGFVANRGSSDITAFDRKSLQVFQVIATGRAPTALALDQRARRLYVALAGEDSVAIVDVLAGRVTDRIPLSPGDEPGALALTPDGSTLLTANEGSSTVSLVDTRARFELTRIAVGRRPRSIVTDEAGRRAFVFNARSGDVSVIDLARRVVARSIPTEPGPVRGHLARRGDRLYVVHESAPYVTVIDPRALTVAGRFPIRAAMEAIEVDPATDLIYLGARREPGVGVHEPFSFAMLDVLDTGAGIVHMATDAQENTLHLASPGANRVFVFSRLGRRPVGALDVGDRPSWISLMGEP